MGAFLKGAPESMGAWSQGTLSEKNQRKEEGLDLAILTGEATWVQDLCRAPRSALRKVAGRAGHKSLYRGQRGGWWAWRQGHRGEQRWEP